MPDEQSPQIPVQEEPPRLPEEEGRTRSFLRRSFLPIVLAVTVVLVFAAMNVWRSVSVRRAEDRLEAETARFAAERTDLVERTAAVYVQGKADALTLFAIPLAWAVRREVISGNLDQVDQYFTELVKLKGFSRVVLAGADGAILVSSDRKHLGGRFETLYPPELLAVQHTRLVEASPGKYVVVVPIMGLNERRGTLAVSYEPEPFQGGP